MDELKQTLTHYCEPDDDYGEYSRAMRVKIRKSARSKIKSDNLKRLGEAYAEAVANGTLKPKLKRIE